MVARNGIAMANGPSKRDLLNRAANSNSNTDTQRRRVLQSGIIATVGSVLGISSLGGAASAEESGVAFEVKQRQTDLSRLDKARPLLDRLSDEELIDSPSPDAFQAAPLGSHQSGTATLQYDDRTGHTYVLRRSGSKLTVNLTVGGSPHAIYAPDGSGPGERVRFDQIGGTIEMQDMEYTEDVSTEQTAGSDCASTCGGSTCSPAGNCWFADRECVEDCRQDNGGDFYCHDDCSCGC
jgi:hypothetical protein